MSPPTRRAVITVCVAILLVFAGCNGGTTTTSTATTTPASTTTTTQTTTPTGTWSPNASTELYPPGVASNGTLTNVSALVDAHFEVTANESLVFTSVGTGPDEHRIRRYAHGGSPTPYYSSSIRTYEDEKVVIEYYQTESNGFLKRTVGNQTDFSVTQNTSIYANNWLTDGTRGPRFSLKTTIMLGNYSVNGTVERNGQTFVQLSADTVSQRGQDLGTTGYEGTVLVTPDGVIHNVDAATVQENDDTKERYETSITLDTGVEWSGQPAWVADIPHLSLSIVEGGHALEIRNTGGTALPAGTTFEVAGSNEMVWGSSLIGDVEGTVTTDARIEPGEAVYVIAETDGNAASFTLHDEPTRGEYSFGAARIQRMNENVTYRLVTGVKTD